MRSARPAAVALALALGACTHLGPREPAPTSPGSELSHQILVTVAQDRALTLGLIGDPGRRYLRRRGYGAAPDVDRIMDQLAREHAIRRVQGWPITVLDVYCEVFEADADRDIDSLLRALERDPRVDLAQRMNVFETQVYNDAYADLQTSVARLDVEAAHRLATGRGVSVGIIDSQLDWRHPDMRGRVRLSRDFVGTHPLRADPEVHGTAVAGIIASIANNDEGIVGIAPDVELAGLRACWSVGGSAASRCSTLSLAQALEASLKLDLDVVNLSLAGPEDPLLAELLDTAIATGMIVVASARESGADIGFPASHTGVIAARSEVGPGPGTHRLLVSAPGREILTTVPGGGYAFLSGNSLAAAHVTGVVALMLERAPSTRVDDLVRLLTETTITDGAARSINACRAVARLTLDDSCDRDEAIAHAAR